MNKVRAAQWSTGNIGKFARRGLLHNPGLALVAIHAHAESKAGLDAGPLCGRPGTGVAATSDIAAITASVTTNAIRQVQAARPDVLTLHDIGLSRAPAGASSHAA